MEKNTCSLEFVVTTKVALLERTREHMADYHAVLCESQPGHRAIAVCACDCAREYRAIRAWVRKQHSIRDLEIRKH